MPRTTRGTVTRLENLVFNSDDSLPTALRQFDIAKPIGYVPGTIKLEVAIYPVNGPASSDTVILHDVAAMFDHRFFVLETTDEALDGMIIVVGYNTRSKRFNHGRYVFYPHAIHHEDRLWNALEALQRYARVR